MRAVVMRDGARRRLVVTANVEGSDLGAVLDGLIAMAKDLGTEIVAEGVETEAQATYLRAHGVVLAQGFLFATAVPAADFVELLASAPRW